MIGGGSAMEIMRLRAAGLAIRESADRTGFSSNMVANTCEILW